MHVTTLRTQNNTLSQNAKTLMWKKTQNNTINARWLRWGTMCNTQVCLQTAVFLPSVWFAFRPARCGGKDSLKYLLLNKNKKIEFIPPNGTESRQNSNLSRRNVSRPQPALLEPARYYPVGDHSMLLCWHILSETEPHRYHNRLQKISRFSRKRTIEIPDRIIPLVTPY